MINRLVQYKSSFEIGNSLYRFASYGSSGIAIASIFLIDRIDLLLLSVFFNFFLAYLYTLKSIRRAPGMILLLISNIIYLQIPFLFMFSKDTDYTFQGFITTPNDDAFYYEYIFPGSLFFIVSYLLLIFGTVIGNSFKFKKGSVNEAFKNPNTIYAWIAIGLITFYFIYLDNRANVAARTDDLSKNVSILAFFFSDKTYQVIFPVLFFLIPIKSKTKSLRYFFFGVLLFFALNLDGASKASILLIFTTFFLTPLAIFYQDKREIIWPKSHLLIMGAAISVPLFIFTAVAREISGTGVTISTELIVNLYKELGNIDFSIMTDLIWQRLAAVINNFLLIYSHYSQNIDLSYRAHFASYSSLSFLNLVLPGTPFPDAYVPTSQLFPKVLDQSLLESHLDNVTLRQQANTQPYSYFGFLMIIFGKPLTLVISFFSGIIFSMMYQLTSQTYIKSILVFAFSVLFHAYAFEAGLQFIIITFFTAVILVYMMKFFDTFKLG